MIRKALLADSAGIAALFRETMHDPWKEAEILDAMQNEHTSVWVWTENGEICGALMVRTLCDEAEIFNIAVTATSRRKGIGENLLFAAMDEMPDNTTIFLEVRAKNTGAIAFYTAMGFAPFSCRRAYYQNPSDDAVCMKKIKISK